MGAIPDGGRREKFFFKPHLDLVNNPAGVKFRIALTHRADAGAGAAIKAPLQEIGLGASGDFPFKIGVQVLGSDGQQATPSIC